MRRIWFVAIFASSLIAAAQQPKVINAQLHAQSAGAGLSAIVDQLKHSSGPQWLGYAVPAVPGSRFSMCSSEESMKDDSCCGVYRLEAENNNYRSSDGDHGTEASIAILVRIDQGTVDKVRFIGTSCQLDDGVAWLSSLVNADSKRHSDQALAAIAMHETSKATSTLEAFVSSANPLWLREKGAFWLGAGRGHDGYLALKKLTSDPDPEFRKKVSF